MKVSLKRILVIAVIVADIGGHAYAQQATTPATPATPTGRKNQICATEHQNVIAACKNGDPCSAACKQAHKAMKACRVANNLPVKQHAPSGNSSPCAKSKSSMPGSAPPSGSVPPSH